jgi:hypothetical protein
VRRAVILGLVTLLVLGLGGAAAVFGVRAHLLGQQRDDYQAGHAAYRRADCVTAVPRLTAAQAGRFRGQLDQSVRAAAARDRAACQAYLSTRTRAAAQPLENAMAVWLVYTDGQAADPLILAGRARLRALVREDVEKKQVSLKFCTDTSVFIGDQIVRMVPDDDLAAPLLAACGRRFNKARKWRPAYNALGRLQGEFARTAAARGSIDDLAEASRGVARTTRTISISHALKLGTDPTLKGAARIRVINMAPEPMDVVTGGRRAALANVPPCRACSYSTHPNAASDCRQTTNWGRRSLVVPARTVGGGRSVPLQAWFFDVSDRYEPGLGFSGVPRIEPNGVYVLCAWRFQPSGPSGTPEPSGPIRTA